MKQAITNIPVLGSVARAIYRQWINPPKPFPGSENYWIERYNTNGNSGVGSYGKLAEFKAEIINEFVRDRDIKTVIEYGCGDGNQLQLAEYPSYLGFDVSPKAVAMCRDAFRDDTTKGFKLVEDYSDETAELTLSLDVIYHLIEDSVFDRYMNVLFDSSQRFVILYASDTDVNALGQATHVKHRKFSVWVKDMKPEWELLRRVPNRYPYKGDTQTGSFADFFMYQKRDRSS